MANCPFCGEKMRDGVCGSCGYREYRNDEILGEAVEKESKVIYDEPQEKSRYNGYGDAGRYGLNRELGTLWKVIFVLISLFFSPIIGIICSIVLITRPYPYYRSFGIKLLILNIVILALQFILVIGVGLLNFAAIGSHRIIEHGLSVFSILM